MQARMPRNKIGIVFNPVQTFGFQGDTIHNEKEIKQRATNCVAYVVLGMVIYFSKHKCRGTRAWTGKSF
jgi:hypothetical protein